MTAAVSTSGSLALVAPSIGIVRLIPSPERSAYEYNELFHVSHDKDAQQMRILSADKDRLCRRHTRQLLRARRVGV